MKNKLKLLRAERGITQDELAKILGITRPALSNIETGKFSPKGRLVIKIANYFGIPAEQIFFEDSVLQEEQNVI
ncbi:MAG: helix-turn-helix transcriptional regulator [Clostridium lundense]|nr:helix-turn-helix transcriptional regulator [Clostridium lundense]